MLEKGKIDPNEFHVIVIAFTIGTAILHAPSLLAGTANQDAWIASALTLLFSLFFIYIYNQLVSLYPFMTFVEMNEKVLGKWIGKITAFLYLFYIFHILGGGYRGIGDFFTTQVMVETPIEIIIIMFVLTSLIGVRLGLEVICRSALIFFPWIMMLLLMLSLLLIPELKFENIQPIFGEGLKPIMNGLYTNLSLPYLQLAILLMITPFVTQEAKMRKTFYIGTIIGGMTLTILVMFSILILGTDTSARQSYAAYVLGKKISIGDFLERIEVIVTIIWILTIYFKLTICYYGLSLGLAQVLGLKSYKILAYPLGILIITFSIFMHSDVVHVSNYITKTLPPYSITICFFLPLLLLSVGKIRKNISST
ncbi:GerAB/ArcD/ProY family transporter [Niallia endozanthoxylica]|uniref:GerAB/ArcD/ProY family transporter n=1 Tax=Niallia endozanthoxylica TaxID=2036016 RepID=A0A5J5H5A9_9BACI|nr:endospore germination permease [Niallia endozanthoxylica]KAA9014903.1 GerAB/ArcD/ProY family transporter [Niallia endozanthoxylica]